MLYYLPTVKVDKSGPEWTTEYRFDQRIPNDVGEWIEGTFQKPNESKKNWSRYYVNAAVSWDSAGNFNPLKGGCFNLVSGRGTDSGRSDFFSAALIGDNAFASLLDSLVVEKSGTWRTAVFLMMVHAGEGAIAIKSVKVPVPPEARIRSQMRDIGEEQAKPANYNFPNVEVPSKLDEMRKLILDLGNLGRKDPYYRRGYNAYEKPFSFATDLGGETVTGPTGPEKIYHDKPDFPYFNDLVLDPKLNDAAQYMAEYYGNG